MLQRAVLTLVLLMLAWQAHAVLTIEIEEAETQATPVAILPFQGEAEAPQKLSEIVGFDMRRSGKFRALPVDQLPELPLAPGQIHFEQWRDSGSDVLLMGKIAHNVDGTWRVEATLVDLLRRSVLFARVWPSVKTRQLSRVAHQISDRMYEELTGIPGAFDTRIAYVVKQGEGKARRFLLNVSDSDGLNEQTVLRSYEAIMSPDWSPDGRKLAYVSFENGRSEVFVQNLFTGKREKVASFKGINGAPAWSPDGRKLAFTTSKDGNAEIYILDLATRKLQRLTRNPAIDTEPCWAPNGRSIYFTSDRRGKPQIFQVFLDTGETRRVTFEGTYNATPTITPDGRYLAMVTSVPGVGMHIGLLDLYSNEFRILTRTFLDESPSFAPNGDMLIYAMNKDNRGMLAVVSVDGGASQILRVKAGEVREPDWGPYMDQIKGADK
ncbi:TolB protein [Sulfurivirga caldicuralii]|uniref:Tol-Pal system protein TolB n=1 Tax=Sulfurivirga caldicuralii TaxID=364032 RepID=A0A1N6EQS0_9GAMM|nr:Tol-Pal system beta propeller repeat protein TolB [Sulfurivirga caldicuralii]SIN85291.1 TolB protein [Sulfurivirga caldicuralii]